MAEITSFNQLFWEAKQAGLRLNSFHTLDDGSWAANWRSGETFFDRATAATPFEALLRAYEIARSGMSYRERQDELARRDMQGDAPAASWLD